MALSNSNGGRVAIIGASGYGGLQLVKLISDHPEFVVSYLAGSRSAGKHWNSINPFINIESDKEIFSVDIDEIVKSSDYAILSLPNGLSSQFTPILLEKGIS